MPVFSMFCVYGSGGTADSAVVGLATAIELGSPQYFTLNQIDCDPSLRFDGGRIVFTSAGEGMSPLFAPGLGAKSSVYPPFPYSQPTPPQPSCPARAACRSPRTSRVPPQPTRNLPHLGTRCLPPTGERVCRCELVTPDGLSG